MEKQEIIKKLKEIVEEKGIPAREVPKRMIGLRVIDVAHIEDLIEEIGKLGERG